LTIIKCTKDSPAYTEQIYDSNLLSWTAPSRSPTHSHPYSAVRSPKEEATQPDRFTPHTGMSARFYIIMLVLNVYSA